MDPTDGSLLFAAFVTGVAAAAGAALLARERGPAATAEEPTAPASASVATPTPVVSAPPASAAPDLDAGSPDGGVAWSPRVPAALYGTLGGAACDARVRERGIAVTPTTELGVDRPVRLAGPLHGVAFHGGGLAGKKGASSPFDIVDCRLVLALDDMAARLSARGIVEVVYFSIHRPAPPPPPPPRRGAKPAPKPTATKKSERPSQHLLGLAIDVGAFVKGDGTRLEVKTDWHGAIGDAPCSSPPREPTPAALELRAIVCELRDLALFNVILTPDANPEHFDHLHLDLTRDARWFILE